MLSELICPRISTHAPAQGATTSLLDFCMHGTFQPTPPRRGRHEMEEPSRYKFLFQPTPPRRGRRRPLRHRHRYRGRFQPTPPRRGRHRNGGTVSNYYKFQPTPPRRGRRFFGGVRPAVLCISTHAPAQGATRRGHKEGGKRYFNPRPRAGGDRFRGGGRRHRRFQPTPPRRGRQSISHTLM